MPRIYRSIFLDDGWAHQRYFGWVVVEDGHGLRVLKKRRAVFDRYLLLLTADGEAFLEDAVARVADRFGRSDILIHDFDAVIRDVTTFAGRIFHRAGRHERVLNIATFAIDLERDESAIFAAMSPDYRRKIRKAEANGFIVEAHEHPSLGLREGFFTALMALATERGLNTADSQVIEEMYRAGDAILFVVRKGDRISNYLHVYKSGVTGIFMYGVNLSRENDGSGQYLHWQAMRYLKAKGFGWYDLGGVATTDPSDGIYNFKQRFGGSLLKSGGQWRHAGRCIRLAQAAVLAADRMTARRGAK